MPLKSRLNDDANWGELGMLLTQLDGTPYMAQLHMRHWHQRWTYIKREYPEPHINTVMSYFLKPGYTFIEIGANVGVFTLYGVHYVGDEIGRVIAIEPNPYSKDHLWQHLVLNHIHGVELHQVALGAENGTLTLHDCSDASVGSSLRQISNADDTCDVQVVRGDDLLRDVPDDAYGLCKIDVEGFEMQVLSGMMQFVESHPNFAYIIEVTDEWLRATGSSADELFALFMQRGFRAYCIVEPHGKLHPIKQPLSAHQYDVLFTRYEPED